MKKHLLFTCALTTSALSLNAAVDVLFQDAADLANFNLTNVADAETLVVNPSNLDGDAISQYDNNTNASSSRTVMRYYSDTAFTDGIQVSYDVYDMSTANANPFRIGPDGANLSLGTAISLGIQLASSGSIVAETSLGNILFTNAFTPATRFNVSVVYNTSGTDLDLSSEGGPVLATKEWAIFVNGAILEGGTIGANPTTYSSANLTEKNSGTVTGAQDLWWLTGTSGSSAGMNIQYDNIRIATGTDISVVPEPAAYAALLGLLALLFVMKRRRRG